MFGVEFLKNGSEIKKSPRWRKLYCNKLQNDTPYDPVEVLPKAVGGGANRFLRFLQSSRCITRGSVDQERDQSRGQSKDQSSELKYAFAQLQI